MIPQQGHETQKGKQRQDIKGIPDIGKLRDRVAEPFFPDGLIFPGEMAANPLSTTARISLLPFCTARWKWPL
jgi:hypothetical protein